MNVLYSLFRALSDVLGVLLSLYVWVLIVGALLSWLVAFDVVNMRNRFVQAVSDFIYRVTEPALAPIRKRLPVMGGVDLSPIILILLIMFIQSFLRHLSGV